MRNPYTRAVIRDMLSRPEETAETVQEWLELYPHDRRELVLRFATQLADDYQAEHEGFEDDLLGTLAELGLRRVNWTAVARAVLRRHAPRPAVMLHGLSPSAN
jgi:hypothetical protein